MSSNIQIEKVCQWCGKNFIARTTQTAYCSKRCAEHAYKDRKRKEKMERCKEEVRRVQTGMKEIDEKEFLTPRQAAQYLGLCYKTFYIYINKGVIKAWKLNRKTLVKRSDIDTLFAATERTTIAREETPISEFYTTQEVLDKYQVSNGWFWKVCKEKKIPKTVYRGKNMWSKAHVDRAFAKKPTPEGITEWHTVAEIQEKFGMTLSAIYNLASKEGIPKTKVGKEVRYSKNHFDVAKVVAEPEPPAEYTIAEAMAKFGMTRDQLYHYVKTYKITRTKRGKFTYLSREELDDLLAPPTI